MPIFALMAMGCRPLGVQITGLDTGDTDASATTTASVADSDATVDTDVTVDTGVTVDSDVTATTVDTDTSGTTTPLAWPSEWDLPGGAPALSGGAGESAGRELAVQAGSLAIGLPNVVYVVRGPVTADASIPDVAAAKLTSGSGDGLGHALAFVGDLDHDGLPDLVVGQEGTQAGDDYGRYTGGVWVVSGAASGPVADVGAPWTASEREAAGWDVAGCGDVTGDGVPDVLIGAPEAALSHGAAYVLDGAHALDGGGLPDAPVKIEGQVNAYTGYFGSQVGDAGDVDGDGVSDLAVGAVGYYGDASHPEGAGAVYVFDGPLAGSYADLDADAIVHGGDYGMILGMSGTDQLAGLGDVDGDGRDDLAVGLPDENGLALTGSPGAVDVFTGADLHGVLRFRDASAVVSGTGDVRLGQMVVGPGDVDGDGLADLLAGAPGGGVVFGEPPGTVCLFAGPDLVGDLDLAAAETTFVGGDGWAVGNGIAGGELTGDGRADVVVAAPGAGADGNGQIFVLAEP